VRFDTFITMKIHIVVFWVMTPCTDVVEYHCFRSCCGRIPWFQKVMLPSLSQWRWRQMALQNVSILPHHYTMS